MKNLIKNIILAFSLLGFVTLTACGQTENTHNQEKTTKVEKVVKKEDLPKQNASTLSTTDAKYFENLGITTDQVALILEHNQLTIEQLKNKTEEETRDLWTKTKKQTTLTTPVIAATETSTVSLGAEQADDDLFSIDLTGGALVASKARIAKKKKENNDKRKTNEGKRNIVINENRKQEIGRNEGEALDIENAKLKKQLSAVTGKKGVNKEEKKAPEQ